MIIEIQQPIGIYEQGKRQNQEDCLYPRLDVASNADRLFVLCDGMGGHENGEVASQLVCDVLPEFLREHRTDGVLTDDMLQDAIDEVFRRINAIDKGSARQMGTTLTMLALHQGGATMAHIGDSRIYHLRPPEGRILYKSRDHSLAYDLFLAGEITLDEMKNYPRKNVITRAIMPGLERQPRLDIAHTTDIQAGDYFFLCSDGMLEQMSDGQLLAILSADDSDEAKQHHLIDETQHNADNHSAWIIAINNITNETNDAQQKNDETTVRCNAMLYETVESSSSVRESAFYRFLKRLI